MKRICACTAVMTAVLMMAPAVMAAEKDKTPEIAIHNVTRKQVIDKIVEWKLEKQMKIKSVNDYGVVAGKIVDPKSFASILYASSYDPNPESRIIYNVVEVDGGVRVFSRCEIVTNPNSPFEHINDTTRDCRSKLQDELHKLRMELEFKQDQTRTTQPQTKP